MSSNQTEPSQTEPAEPEPSQPEPGETEPNWLSAEEQRSWRGLLRSYQLLFDGIDRSLRAETGMPHAYYVILAMLSESPDRELRMSDLALATATSQSQTSHAVAALERKGWVTRRRASTDRRGQLAKLTDEGYQVLVKTAPTHVADVRRFVFDRLTAEQVRQLISITEAINAPD